MRLAFLFAAFIAFAAPAFAMDGTNQDTGDTITVDDGTTFKEGDTITAFDADGNEMQFIVNAVKETDKTINVDLADPDSGDAATFEFPKSTQ